MNVTKVIIPVAGYGTRRLPVSKSVEKCMIPVLNRPIVDYIVQDCIKAGIREFYFVINKGATQLKDFYSANPTLETYLNRNGKQDMISLIQPPGECTFNFIEQEVNQTYGTTVPVWLCRDAVKEGERVLVIMGDQFFFNPDGSSEAAHFLQQAAAAGTPSAMLAVEVPRAEVSKYGIVSLKKQGNFDLYERIVEKPAIEDAPSNLNNGSFYLVDRSFFAFLESGMKQTGGGELMITDVLNAYSDAGNQVAVIRNQGEYLDCGTVDGWLGANNRVAEVVAK